MYRNDIAGLSDSELRDLLENNGYNSDNIELETIEGLLEIEFECIEDDILDSIYNGNWSDSAKQMYDDNITPTNLIDYIEERRDELDYNVYDWFSLAHAVGVTEAYNTYRGRM